MNDVYCFGGNPLDRVSERRDDDTWIAALVGDPDTRLLALRDLKPFTRGTTIPALDWQPVAQWRDQIDGGAPLIFLGLGEQLHDAHVGQRIGLEAAQPTRDDQAVEAGGVELLDQRLRQALPALDLVVIAADDRPQSGRGPHGRLRIDVGRQALLVRNLSH